MTRIHLGREQTSHRRSEEQKGAGGRPRVSAARETWPDAPQTAPKAMPEATRRRPGRPRRVWGSRDLPQGRLGPSTPQGPRRRRHAPRVDAAEGKAPCRAGWGRPKASLRASSRPRRPARQAGLRQHELATALSKDPNGCGVSYSRLTCQPAMPSCTTLCLACLATCLAAPHPSRGFYEASPVARSSIICPQKRCRSPSTSRPPRSHS